MHWGIITIFLLTASICYVHSSSEYIVVKYHNDPVIVKGPYSNLQRAKNELKKIARNDRSSERMMLEIIDGEIQLNPHIINGREQTSANGFDKFWHSWRGISQMVEIVKYRMADIYSPRTFIHEFEVTNNGEKCVNKCRHDGYSYTWCYTSVSQSWDYCTPYDVCKRPHQKAQKLKSKQRVYFMQCCKATHLTHSTKSTHPYDSVCIAN